jgi:uncharacterized protein (DUF433 family)
VSTKADEHRVVSRDPDIHGGDPVFAGTRVPVQILVDYLEGGDGLELFLDQYPTVSRDQAEAAVAIMRQALLSA